MNIKEARAFAGLTQKQVSELIGVPTRTLQNWEGGQRKCPEWSERQIVNAILLAKSTNEKEVKEMKQIKIKKIIDIYGKDCSVDENTKKLYNFNNDKGEIEYNAQIIEGGKRTIFYTNYIEEGKLYEIDQKLETWNNAIKGAYAAAVNYDASKYDPNKEIWEKVVNYTKEHESEIFTKTGNFKKKYTVDVTRIAEIAKEILG